MRMELRDDRMCFVCGSENPIGLHLPFTLDGDDCVLEQEPLQQLARDGQLRAYKHGGFFYPVDTYRDYLALNRLWDSGRAPWKVW